MNRRQSLAVLSGAAIGIAGAPGRARAAAQRTDRPGPRGPIPPEDLLLKDYRPRSIYKIPETRIARAKYPVIDCHTHPFFAHTVSDVDQWVKVMDAVGVEKGLILTMATGQKFKEICKRFSGHKDRFEMWCSFDLSQINSAGFERHALEAMEQCRDMGSQGVGEVIDKGRGLSVPVRWTPADRGRWPTGEGLHPGDPRMDPLFDRCGQYGWPVSIHVSDPPWAYQPMDQTNDGLMNAYTWRIDVKPGVMGHHELIASLESAVRKHPKTIFFACHLTNQTNDLTSLGEMLDRNPNLYSDIGARFGEIACIPRFAAEFLTKYSDRILYGTDIEYGLDMYRTTFRILETADEHFYHFEYNYHWYLNGFHLSDAVLKKIYRDNALAAIAQARHNMA